MTSQWPRQTSKHAFGRQYFFEIDNNKFSARIENKIVLQTLSDKFESECIECPAVTFSGNHRGDERIVPFQFFKGMLQTVGRHTFFFFLYVQTLGDASCSKG